MNVFFEYLFKVKHYFSCKITQFNLFILTVIYASIFYKLFFLYIITGNINFPKKSFEFRINSFKNSIENFGQNYLI
jgi:hypothetical protein